MKVIIAGGREYSLTEDDVAYLDNLAEVGVITMVVCGLAPGADTEGRKWAVRRGIPLMYFPAEWDKYKKAAGPIRNRQMAEYGDAAVLFPGGTGTESMYNEATKRGLTIYDRRGSV